MNKQSFVSFLSFTVVANKHRALHQRMLRSPIAPFLSHTVTLSLTSPFLAGAAPDNLHVIQPHKKNIFPSWLFPWTWHWIALLFPWSCYNKVQSLPWIGCLPVIKLRKNKQTQVWLCSPAHWSLTQPMRCLSPPAQPCPGKCLHNSNSNLQFKTILLRL